MPQAHSFYQRHSFSEGFTWWFVRKRIGQDLRERYDVPKGLPPNLLALVRKLDAIEGKYLSRDAPPAEPRVDHPSDDWPLVLEGGSQGRFE
jgi:hypothetical protein